MLFCFLHGRQKLRKFPFFILSMKLVLSPSATYSSHKWIFFVKFQVLCVGSFDQKKKMFEDQLLVEFVSLSGLVGRFRNSFSRCFQVGVWHWLTERQWDESLHSHSCTDAKGKWMMKYPPLGCVSVQTSWKPTRFCLSKEQKNLFLLLIAFDICIQGKRVNCDIAMGLSRISTNSATWMLCVVCLIATTSFASVLSEQKRSGPFPSKYVLFVFTKNAKVCVALFSALRNSIHWYWSHRLSPTNVNFVLADVPYQVLESALTYRRPGIDNGRHRRQYFTSYACERSSLRLLCPPGTSVIPVHASYGRSNMWQCTEGQVDRENWSNNCFTPPRRALRRIVQQ